MTDKQDAICVNGATMGVDLKTDSFYNRVSPLWLALFWCSLATKYHSNAESISMS